MPIGIFIFGVSNIKSPYRNMNMPIGILMFEFSFIDIPIGILIIETLNDNIPIGILIIKS